MTRIGVVVAALRTSLWCESEASNSMSQVFVAAVGSLQVTQPSVHGYPLIFSGISLVFLIG